MTFESLLKKHNVDVFDFLQIDTEGFDYEIIKMVDFEKYKPKMINYEEQNLSEKDTIECRRFLRNKGYSLFRHGRDVLAVRL